MTSSPYVHFSHANVQRGLAAAPFAIPAPGRKSPLRGSRALFPPAMGRARQYIPVLSCPRTGSLRCAPACGETARPIFLSRSKTLRADVFFNPVTVGRVSAAHPPPGFRRRLQRKYARAVTSFRSPFHHPDIFWLSQNLSRLGENPSRLPPIKKVGALCAPTSQKPIILGSLACVTTPRWRRRSRGGLSATARPG